jgi:transcription termination factor NusB
MNIDERLEALTHSVELLAAMHKDNEARAQQWMQATDKRIQADEKQMRRLGKYTRAVLHMVLDHETRLRAVEGDEEEDDETGSALV